jgi:hypothetical protein
MKKRQIGILLMVLGMIGASSATRILWCSSGTNDQGWVDLLVADGYTVDRLEAAATMTQAKVDLANTYDLVIVGRDTNGGDYSGTGEVALWNSITKPMICQSAFIVHSGRWKWLNNGTATAFSETNLIVDLAAGNPLYDALFNGVAVGENRAVNYAANSVSLVQTASAGNGTLIGHRDHTTAYVYAAYWAQGLEFYSNSATYANGPRMALFAGNTVDATRGALNVTDDGKLIFLNAVYYMSGATFNRKPFVSAGTDRIANVGQTITLDASTFDPDSTLTISWTQVSGPAAAVFEDAAAVDAKVTFPAKGVYTLKLTVSDGTTTISDQLTATVRDNADNALIAHWNFDSLPEPNTLIDVTGNGFTGIYYRSTPGEPNIVAGNMIAGPSVAADLTAGNAYWEIPNGYANTDPNLNDLATGMTAAVWVKISDNSIGAPMIIGNGLNGWRLQVNVGNFNLACQPSGLDLVTSGINPYDGFWHHVVGVFDGVASKAYIYVDGQLAATGSVTPGSQFIKGTSYPIIQIANRGDADRPWKGYIDDIRLYNYPLSDSEIAALAAEGNLRVKVTAGSDQTVAYKGVPVQLSGALLSDDGYPALATLGWSVVSVPEGADPAAVMFNNASIANPQVTFPNVQGTYILRLTANDTEYTVFDDVNIMILIPSCADVIADGLGFAADISGPQNVSDCRIDIHDFAEMASNWLRCNDPRDEDCEWAYQQ